MWVCLFMGAFRLVPFFLQTCTHYFVFFNVILFSVNIQFILNLNKKNYFTKLKADLEHVWQRILTCVL